MSFVGKICFKKNAEYTSTTAKLAFLEIENRIVLWLETGILRLCNSKEST